MKFIDTALLSILNEQYTPPESQFVFQEVVAVTQALLQAEDNAGTGMRPTAVLDLEKAYDRVDRRLLLGIMKEWIDDETIKMTRTLLGPLMITAKEIPPHTPHN